MSEQDNLVGRRNSASSDLEDLEFERFAVGLGCAPKLRERLDESIESVSSELSTLDNQIAAAEQKRQELVRRADPRNWTKAHVDDVFQALIKTLH